MSLSKSGRLALRFSKQAECTIAVIPTFLCPGLTQGLQLSRSSCHGPQKQSQTQRRFIQSQDQVAPESISATAPPLPDKLPVHCAGCGALSQTVTKNEAGYYSLTRRSVKEFLGTPTPSSKRRNEEDEIITKALENADSSILSTLAIPKPVVPATASTPATPSDPPLCDRCHNLQHHETGVSIQHPSIRALQQTISESPYKYNHIYHVIDAADFPMSFIPALTRTLNLAPLRSHNRRSKPGKFYGGRKTEISFVITRSDLLAPLKIQVDSMMPYLTGVLREVLGRSGRDVRLGNVTCVSAMRGWWTSGLKEDIWGRGGGNWLVGKVNVGKSQLFKEIYPKGRGKSKVVVGEPLPLIEDTVRKSAEETPTTTTYRPIEVESEETEEDFEPEPLDENSLLPPAQEETDYPSMPLVSSLPGTTASPIRVPFGNNRGELIDLPGLSRGDLEVHVEPAHRSSLVMRSRIKPEQQVLKAGQSLLLGGFIRITPTSDMIILAYAFTPIAPHVTSTEKAIGIQTRTRETTVQNISLVGTEQKIALAGTYPLKWDVTKQRTGPLTAPAAVGLRVEQLPYRVLATDILVEGCGWVELVVQVSKSRIREGISTSTFTSNFERRKSEEAKWGWEQETGQDDSSWPSVEVYTPEGKFIAARKPMNAWMYCVKKPSARMKGRPRKSMKGAKKQEKSAKRQSAGM